MLSKKLAIFSLKAKIGVINIKILINRKAVDCISSLPNH